MSREFKFKCWDKELKYWLKPDEMPTLMSGEIGAVWEFGGEEDYIFCQYTGLKDKNGKEIYEGDIIKYNKTGWGPEDWSVPTVVVWNNNYARFQTLIGGCQGLIYNQYEIIGNIHENPELLTHPAEGRN